MMNIDRFRTNIRSGRVSERSPLPAVCAALLAPILITTQSLDARTLTGQELQRIAQAAPAPQTVPNPAASQGANATPAQPARSIPGQPNRYQVGQGGDISLNYVDTDVRELVRLILGEILKLNYSIDPGYQGTVTIQTARPLRRDELITTLQGLLTQAGGQLTYQNGIYRVSPIGDDTNIPPVVGGGSMEAGTEVVPLRYASAKQLATMLETFAAEGIKIVADPSRNVLILSGSASARQNILNLIHVFDVDYLANRSYAFYPVKSGDPVKFAADLEGALQLEADGALVGAVKIVPVEQANAVMVISRQPDYLNRVAQLVDQLDKVKSTAGRNIHVYYLKNTQPADIQPLLQRAVNPPASGSTEGGTEEVAPGNLPPTAAPAQLGTASPAAPGPAAPSGAAMAQPGQSAFGTAPTPPAPSSRDSGNAQQAGVGNPKGPQIIADTVNGALIVVSTDSEYETIETAIRKLDVLPKQVLVEATIVEVTLNRQLQYGVQFFLQNGTGQIALSNAVSATPTVINPSAPVSNSSLFPGVLAPSFPGLAVSRTFGGVQGALQALQNITDVQLVSAPKLLIMDRQRASFQVGDLVPIITQSATSVVTAGAPVVNNVAYQPTGVILNVTPHINSGGLVTLDIEQQVSDVVTTTTSTINSPTFEQRSIKTKVIVQDGETISLAGLISDNKTKGTAGVPFLQEIPILGTLFSTKNNSQTRTELLVMLTPRVVNDQRDARALTEELKRKLSPSGILP